MPRPSRVRRRAPLLVLLALALAATTAGCAARPRVTPDQQAWHDRLLATLAKVERCRAEADAQAAADAAAGQSPTGAEYELLVSESSLVSTLGPPDRDIPAAELSSAAGDEPADDPDRAARREATIARLRRWLRDNPDAAAGLTSADRVLLYDEHKRFARPGRKYNPFVGCVFFVDDEGRVLRGRGIMRWPPAG